MTNINKELQDYLTRNEKGDQKSGVFTNLLQTSSMGKFFSASSSKNVSSSVKGEDNNNGGSWFSNKLDDSVCPSLSRRQRILGFVLCIAMGLVCFTLASLYFPVLLLKTRKFALLYSMGSLFIISSFSLLWGPWNHVKHLFSQERLFFTTIYFGTLFSTLYCALWLKSTLLTGAFAACQIISLVWYLLSYIPGGQTGLRYFSRLFTSTVKKTASNTLPV